MSVRSALPLWLLLSLTAGCSCATAPDGRCTSSADCAHGLQCVDSRCVGPDVDSAVDAAVDGAHDAFTRPVDAPTSCLPDGGGCPSGTACDPVTSLCFTPTTSCTADTDCRGDTHCSGGFCIPYLPGEFNHACTRPSVPGFLAPARLCSFTAAPAGDAHPTWLSASPGLVAADLQFGPPSPEPHPSIVAVMHANATYGMGSLQGIIRVLDGATCAQQTVIEAHLVHLESGPAIGDLDGDGRPEIVAMSIADSTDPTPGGLVAFRLNTTTHQYELLWRSHTAAGAHDSTYGMQNMWAGPSIVDLDDDGVPEVLIGGAVYDSHGVLIDAHLAASVDYLYNGTLRLGQFAVTADVDGDARHIPELITGNAVYAWDTTTHQWAPWSGFAPPVALTDGLVAIGDFGDFPGTVAGDPEVAVVAHGQVRVQTIHGVVVFGPIALPGGGQGGPPTAADFNGDGHLDFAAAGLGSYTVFDLQCTAAATGCHATGIRWSRPSQDGSSSVTGSSVFDFNGDGAAEATYADECFVRVYDGSNGDVVFSSYRSSCTWFENPIVLDVNGDLKAEVVIGSDDDCGITCASLSPMGYDSLFPGLRCATSADCPTPTMTCDANLCRCTADAECGPGYGCRAADTGTAGTGNVCRAMAGSRFGGVVVLGDPAGRWVSSRPIWNEHPYTVTNVDDHGTIPASHLRERNWLVPGLNDFRQNAPGSLAPTDAPSLTVSHGSVGVCTLLPSGVGSADLAATVCNRGTGAIASGLPVSFEVDLTDAGMASIACTAMTMRRLDPGGCEDVTCTWDTIPPNGRFTVNAVPDPAHHTLECLNTMSDFALPQFDCRPPI